MRQKVWEVSGNATTFIPSESISCATQTIHQSLAWAEPDKQIAGPIRHFLCWCMQKTIYGEDSPGGVEWLKAASNPAFLKHEQGYTSEVVSLGSHSQVFESSVGAFRDHVCLWDRRRESHPAGSSGPDRESLTASLPTWITLGKCSHWRSVSSPAKWPTSKP